MLRNKLFFLVFLLTFISCFCHGKSSYADGDWSLTAYGARLTADSLGDTLKFSAKYEDSYISVFAVTRRVFTYKGFIDVEIEGQAAKHFGEQNHLEFNVLPVVRWLPFPWDRYIDTSIAAGAGLSYALETPEVEAIGVSHTPRLLGYLMFELAFSLPQMPKWCFVARVHHRSGANGLFSGRLDASNAIGLGIKYSF